VVVVELLPVAPPAGEEVAVAPVPFFTVVGTDATVVAVAGRVVAPGGTLATGLPPDPPELSDPASAGVVVVVDGAVVVVDGAVVVVAVEVHTAYKVSPPAGIVIDWLFEYDVPVPADEVSHRDSVKPDRVNDAPLLSATVAPEAAYCVEIVPVPPFALYETAGRASHTAYRMSPPAGIVIDCPFE
jgi:hypothetical protein